MSGAEYLMKGWCPAMMVVCNGHVCEMYTLKDGTVCYRSYQTGRVIKREKPAKKKTEGWKQCEKHSD